MSELPPANPASLDEFFSRDPLGLADADIDVIVQELQRQRAAWESGQKAKPRSDRVSVKNLSLSDLGLD